MENFAKVPDTDSSQLIKTSGAKGKPSLVIGIAGLAATLCGVYLIYTSLGFLLHDISVPSTWTKTDGRVLDKVPAALYNCGRLQETSHSFYYDIQYSAADGSKHYYRTTPDCSPFGPRIGDSISLYYNPSNPDESKLQTDLGTNSFMTPLIFFLCPFLLGVFGMYFGFVYTPNLNKRVVSKS